MRVVHRKRAVTDTEMIDYLKEKGYKFFYEYDKDDNNNYIRCIITIACKDTTKTLLIDFAKDKEDPINTRLYSVSRRYMDLSYNDSLDASIYAVKKADNEVHTYPGTLLY